MNAVRDAVNTVLEVADRVWVTEAVAGRTPPSTHRDDLRRAALLPEWRAREFLAGRGLLRRLIAAVHPAACGAAIVPDERGRPGIAGLPGVGVSVSHSGGAVAAGIAVGRAVGVDLQQPADSVSSLFARRVLHGHADRVTALPPERAAEEVAWVWTVQEACVKAGGAGLTGRPWTIDVRPGSRHGHWGAYRWISMRDRSRTPFSCAFSTHPAATGPTAATAPAAPPAPCASGTNTSGADTSGRTPTSDKDRP
ncbi:MULTISPECIES: 4'-phosphopantetheinyl transferase family protein [unclassified Streptomyces]|uniref:4'-phosphopantetheinyl transferase family protein n=1 Tax=unclassified Streptomyces TaxID=2593676 RepID=UPI002E1A2124|nr:4-phosphopantetheinyl transferase [Streptomyces sp. NBC_01023]